MQALEEVIGYRFENKDLLTEALTHPSMAYELKKKQGNNQRLEFLGDAVLQLVLTEKLYEMFPDFPEGRLTQLRARLVSKTALEKFARSMGLGDFMILSKGEESSGGRDRASTLADAFESVTGAIYLDGGIVPARDMILNVSADSILQIVESPEESNPKGKLQEILQKIAPQAPVYDVISESGPDHDKKFVIKVIWKGEKLAEGHGDSKKNAAANGAANALKARLWEGN